MGYDTAFRGVIRVAPPLNGAERSYLLRFSRTRQVERPGGPYRLADEQPDEVADANEVAAGKPGRWCDWAPTSDGHLAIREGFQRAYRAAEWLVYLRSHFLSDPAHARGQPEFERFTFDHRLSGEVQAQGKIDGDRWTLSASEEAVGIRRAHMPCAACWVDGVISVAAPSAAYGFSHPERPGDVDRFDAPIGVRDPSLIGPPARCRAGGYRPAVTWCPVVWPLTEPGTPQGLPWEEALAALLPPGAVLEYRGERPGVCDT